MKKALSITTISLLLLGGLALFAYLTLNGQIDANPLSSTIVSVARPYPKLTDPRTVTLSCSYHGKNLSIQETLYGSLDRYYQQDPAKKYAYLHNQNKNFVFGYTEDKTISELTTKISDVARQNGLSSDQTLDLAACFLQSIPYDDAKATKILGPNFSKYPVDQVIPRYPYETLYDFTGICTDKSFLGAAIFRQMGYGTSLLTFDTQKHMSIGISVPAGYGNFGTNYGIMELTGENFRVGDVPEVSADQGLAINQFQTVPQINGGLNVPATLELANPSDVIVISAGSQYSEIINKIALRNKLESLRSQLDAYQAAYKQAESQLNSAEQAVKQAEAVYKANPSEATYASYRTIYAQYTAAYNNAQSKIGAYNALVNTYNSYVKQYQQL